MKGLFGSARVPRRHRASSGNAFWRSRTSITLLIVVQVALVVFFFHDRRREVFNANRMGLGSSSFKSFPLVGGLFGKEESLQNIIADIRMESSKEDERKQLEGFDPHHFHADEMANLKIDWEEQIKGALGTEESKKYTVGKGTKTNGFKGIKSAENYNESNWGGRDKQEFLIKWKQNNPWPPRNGLSLELESLNSLPPRNRHLFPELARDKIIFVLFVHNRPHYLKAVLDSLSKIVGINETLLVVCHDGKYPAMDKLVKSIKFCQVKQIYAPYSPHNFEDTFPNVSVDDCIGNKDKIIAEMNANLKLMKDNNSNADTDVNSNGNLDDEPIKEDEIEMACVGQHDSYKNYRDPHYISFKHHWWWMMNTVWDGLEETRNHKGYLLFIKEDCYLFPNAYAHLKLLLKHQGRLCPRCIAVNLAPSSDSMAKDTQSFVSERMGNLGFSFNRSVWEYIHALAYKFCNVDDYKWESTLWRIMEFTWQHYLSMRWSRRSAYGIGKCELYNEGCNGQEINLPPLEPRDRVININESAGLVELPYDRMSVDFKGFGGWGDYRDQELCKFFTFMYRG